jgi:hypothetical protein
MNGSFHGSLCTQYCIHLNPPALREAAPSVQPPLQHSQRKSTPETPHMLHRSALARLTLSPTLETTRPVPVSQTHVLRHTRPEAYRSG